MRLNCVLSLNHKQLDLYPHVERFKGADDMFIFTKMLPDLLAGYGHGLAIIGPKLANLGLTAHVKALGAHNF